MITSSRQKKALTLSWTPARVVFELHSLGWSLAQLGVKHGYKSNALATALHRPYPKAELLIANTLGLEPQIIWPDRYINGAPKGAQRRKKMMGVLQVAA